MSSKCQICDLEVSKYKCPKCAIRYCSLACFKNKEKHVHDDNNVQEAPKKEPAHDEKAAVKLHTKEFDDIYQNCSEIRELLGYNTVKFHLAKVYRILNLGAGALSTSDMQLSSEMKQQLAVDYLNTLRYGGCLLYTSRCV